MADVSPAAQAVWTAYETADCDPYLVDPRKAGIAAAICALADQVVPEGGAFLSPGTAAEIRAAILAIATELEGQ